MLEHPVIATANVIGIFASLKEMVTGIAGSIKPCARVCAVQYRGVIAPAYSLAQGLILPAMPGVRTSCHSNCKCNWDIRKLEGEGNWDCHWRISAVESCDECLQRQRVFNPLQVRNFIVQPFDPGGIYR